MSVAILLITHDDLGNQLTAIARSICCQDIAPLASISIPANVEAERYTVRTRPMPADGRPAIGPIGPEGLYLVSTHSGMTLAPVIAEMVAKEVGSGASDPRLAPYRPGRNALR